MPHDPNLFFASATEKLCMLLAGQLVETADRPLEGGRQATPALDDFVQVVMGVPPGDERGAAAAGDAGAATTTPPSPAKETAGRRPAVDLRAGVLVAAGGLFGPVGGGRP